MPKIQILIVEDDAPIRNLIATTLKANDYRYTTAMTGAAAITDTATYNPDIILLDLGLPDLDGIEVIKRIRSWSNTPIIVISARTEDTDKIEALDAGADDYLTKPFSVNELLARLRVTQRRLSLIQTTTPIAIYENHALKIDYTSGCVYLNGEELALTPIEYKLLCVLTQNTGKVLTHKFILQTVWGGTWESNLGSLRVFMTSLRKKLESKPGAPQYIQTHVGIGYRMLKIDEL